ncbi:MAG: complex I subunit 1/NuoH family protein, partial [Fervidicoccus fontis]
FQEIIIPRNVDLLPYFIAPILGFVVALLPIASIPISPYYYPSPTSNSILVAVGLTTLPPLLTILAGWSSNNKFSLLGSTREAFLISAYELLIILSAVSAVIIYSTPDFTVAVQEQHIWGIVLNPISAITFYVSVLMATGRFPFEIAEADSEIVMGAYTEYSGLMYGLSMGIPYTRMFVYNLIFTLLFLGGWSPLIVIPGHAFISFVLIPAIIVVVKALIVSLTMVFTRAIYGRLRIDQALGGAWKFWFVVTMVGIAWSIALVWISGGAL